MPLKSEAQRRFLWASNPSLARKFESETPKGTNLPERVNNKSSVLPDEKQDEKVKRSKKKKKTKKKIEATQEAAISGILRRYRPKNLIMRGGGKLVTRGNSNLSGSLGALKQADPRVLANTTKHLVRGVNKTASGEYLSRTGKRALIGGNQKVIGTGLQKHAGKIEKGIGVGGVGIGTVALSKKHKKIKQESLLLLEAGIGYKNAERLARILSGRRKQMAVGASIARKGIKKLKYYDSPIGFVYAEPSKQKKLYSIRSRVERAIRNNNVAYSKRGKLLAKTGIKESVLRAVSILREAKESPSKKRLKKGVTLGTTIGGIYGGLEAGLTTAAMTAANKSKFMRHMTPLVAAPLGAGSGALTGAALGGGIATLMNRRSRKKRAKIKESSIDNRRTRLTNRVKNPSDRDKKIAAGVTGAVVGAAVPQVISRTVHHPYKVVDRIMTELVNKNIKNKTLYDKAIKRSNFRSRALKHSAWRMRRKAPTTMKVLAGVTAILGANKALKASRRKPTNVQ